MAGRRVGLTVKEIENARADGADRWLNDGGGLFLHVRPAGTKTWRLRYTVRGKRRIVDLGDARLKSLVEARQDADQLRRVVDNGLDPIEEQRKAREATEAEERRRQQEIASRRTLADAAATWHKLQLSSRKDGGIEAMRMLRKDIINVLGHRDLRSIGRGDLLACLDGIVARGARVQANHCLVALKQFYRWCEARDWVDRSPLTWIAKKQVGGDIKERDRVLSLDEIRALRDQLPQANLERHAELAIWILLSTLVRVGELSQAAWKDVDLKAGVWYLPETKNGQPHTVFLSEFALRQFRELKELTGWSAWVMPSARKRSPGKEAPQPEIDAPIGKQALTKQFTDRQSPLNKKNRTQAKGTLTLDGGRWTAHDLRRTGSTIMGENGVMSEVIERCLNHKEQRKVVRTYQRQELLPERREAWRVLGDALDEALNNAPRTVVSPDTASRQRSATVHYPQWGLPRSARRDTSSI